MKIMIEYESNGKTYTKGIIIDDEWESVNLNTLEVMDINSEKVTKKIHDLFKAVEASKTVGR